MKRIPTYIRYRGTHMTGVVLAIYGDAPHRLLRIAWIHGGPDAHLYHEDEVEESDHHQREDSRLYPGDSSYSKHEKERHRHEDVLNGYKSIGRR